MLALLSGADISKYIESNSKDANSILWYQPYFAWAHQNGITAVIENRAISPDDNIAREDIATMIYRFVKNSGYVLPKDEMAILFTDEESFSDYSKAAIVDLQQANIISGVKNYDLTFKFLPHEFTTREQAAKMLTPLHQTLINK
jgi:hypothetical protein